MVAGGETSVAICLLWLNPIYLAVFFIMSRKHSMTLVYIVWHDGHTMTCGRMYFIVIGLVVIDANFVWNAAELMQ